MIMERKIGEIFEYNGEWYQCIPDTTDDNCNNCFFQKSCSDITGDCSSTARSDGKSVAFKKLEKVGEPYRRWLSSLDYIIVQKYKLYDKNVLMPDKPCMYPNVVDNTIEIIKQTKEDTEENKLNLKPFDIQKARGGKPVCTRDGRKARIICFDRRLFYKNVSYPILALVECSDGEDDVCGYNEKGKVLIEDGAEYKDDLMMLPEKKEGWINIVKTEDGGYCCKGEVHSDYNDAINENINVLDKRGITLKIEWYD